MNESYLTMEEVKEIELSILKKFTEYCDEHKLVYSLAYGTLLGAIRHKGFIPWDDDIDVMMPREDYEKLLNSFHNTSPIRGCELLNRENNNGYCFPFAKLCDNSTTAKMDDNHTKHGIWVDIFPIDHVPDKELDARKLHRRIHFLRNLVISYTTDFNAKYKNWKLIPKKLFSLIVQIIGIERIVDYLEKESQKYNKVGTQTVAVVCWQSYQGGDISEKELYNQVTVFFEGIPVRIIKNYDEYLSSIYGNYMQMPPSNKRKTHHVIAYRNVDVYAE